MTANNGAQKQSKDLHSGEKSREKKKLILNAFVMTSSAHFSSGLWTHSRNQTTDYKKLKFWIDLAQLLDKADFHALFVADVLGVYDVYKDSANVGSSISSGAQFSINDSLYAVSAMTAATKNLIFGIIVSIIYELSYALARRFSIVDHLVESRVAWNIVISYLESAARNLELETQIEHDERYRIADEYINVVYKLWEDSWRDDAIVLNKKTGQYAILDRVRQIHHRGKYFNVSGPHLCEPSRQRTPLLFQTGTSKSGKEFNAKHAEAIFLNEHLSEQVRTSVDAIRSLAKKKYDRNSGHIKMICEMMIIVAKTNETAHTKRKELLSYEDKKRALTLFEGFIEIDLSTYSDDEDFRFTKASAVQSIVNDWTNIVSETDNLKWNKKTIAELLILDDIVAIVVDSLKTVVNELKRWVEVVDVNDFNLCHIINSGSYEDIIDLVLPELQRRELFRSKIEQEGVTAREAYLEFSWLLEDHPDSRFRWHAGEEAPIYAT